MAHKKAAGSAKNLRDSKPKYRGVKVFGGQKVLAGNIIVRQKGNKYEAGKNAYFGKDFTINASIDGIVEFSKSNKTKFDGRKYLKTFVNVVSAIADKPVSKKIDKVDKPVEKKPTKLVAKKDEKQAEKKVEKKVEKKTTTKKAIEPKIAKVAVKKPVVKKLITKKTTVSKKTDK